MAHLSAEEFVDAAYNCRLNTYNFGAESYIPCWLAPTGEIVTGKSHAGIAEATTGGGYAAMYERGYLRLAPSVRFNGLTVQGCQDTKVTPTMRVTIAKLLKTFKPSKDYTSYVAVGDGTEIFPIVKSAKELLQALQANFA
jgi:hypothetical protein